MALAVGCGKDLGTLRGRNLHPAMRVQFVDLARHFYLLDRLVLVVDLEGYWRALFLRFVGNLAVRTVG